MGDLMFVESPAKIKSIGKYLIDRDIKLIATKGHIRDLAKGNRKWLGFDPKSFEIDWESKDKSIISEIKKAADKANKIYLSTDPDREGEGISWHIFSVIGEKNQKKCLRAVFNEITEQAIKKSLENPRELDQAQVNSYLARRLLDRWIGYKLSNYTEVKTGGKSAGRVQSIALKFLADREEEIKSFKGKSWFTLEVELMNSLKLSLFKVAKDLIDQIRLVEDVGEKDRGLACFKGSVDAENLIQKLDEDYKLECIGEPKISKHSPPETLKTSTLYKLAIGNGMPSSIVERTAQQLYEGINLGGEVISLITYPRTDRTELSEEFVLKIKDHIKSKYSNKYLNSDNLREKKNILKNKDSLVQGAHEGIRPVDLSWTPEKLSNYISESSAEYKVYKIIWAYTISSFSSSSLTQTKRYVFSNQGNFFFLNETEEVFDGYKKIMREYKFLNPPENLNQAFKELKEGNLYKQKNTNIEERKTNPPAKYNESSLISALEKKGIGRPSTYPKISKTVQSRNYVIMNDKKLEITDLGYAVSKDLEKNFSDFISYDYTRLMEEELDNISKSKTDWKKFLSEVFEMWNNLYEKAEKHEKVKERSCPECGKELVFKFSRMGQKFIGCINFPSCKYGEKIEEKLDRNCLQCDSPLARKRNKWGSFFVACTNFPKCKYIEKKEEEVELVENEFCKGCSAQLVYKTLFKSGVKGKKFAACPNYPTCQYREKSKSNFVVLDKNCPRCSKFLKEIITEKGNKFISCSGFPRCRYKEKSSNLKS